MPTPTPTPAVCPAPDCPDRVDEVAREIGRLLRGRRLRRGESLGRAAAGLGVGPDCLERLEQGGFDSRAVPPYTAALLRAHAERLGVDGRALAAVLMVRPAAKPVPPEQGAADLRTAAALLRRTAQPLAGALARAVSGLAGAVVARSRRRAGEAVGSRAGSA